MPKTNHQLGLIALIKRARPINLVTGPIIYSMIFPLLILDAFVSFYQWSCFPIYGIPKLSRKDFIIFDRQELKYLDWISKFHCTYCAYGVFELLQSVCKEQGTTVLFVTHNPLLSARCEKTIEVVDGQIR
jgi:hypothetical protein